MHILALHDKVTHKTCKHVISRDNQWLNILKVFPELNLSKLPCSVWLTFVHIFLFCTETNVADEIRIFLKQDMKQAPKLEWGRWVKTIQHLILPGSMIIADEYILRNLPDVKEKLSLVWDYNASIVKVHLIHSWWNNKYLHPYHNLDDRYIIKYEAAKTIGWGHDTNLIFFSLHANWKMFMMILLIAFPCAFPGDLNCMLAKSLKKTLCLLCYSITCAEKRHFIER